MLAQLEVRSTTFDVVCVGEAMWRLARDTGSASYLRLRPSRGAVNVALQLRERGLRVGLATVLVDDAHGRRVCWGSSSRACAPRSVPLRPSSCASPAAA